MKSAVRSHRERSGIGDEFRRQIVVLFHAVATHNLLYVTVRQGMAITRAATELMAHRIDELLIRDPLLRAVRPCRGREEDGEEKIFHLALEKSLHQPCQAIGSFTSSQ